MLRRRTENTGFVELLSEQEGELLSSQPATKSCFQSVNEIQKLRGHELEEIHIDNSPDSAENRHLFWEWRDFRVRTEILFHPR